MSADVETDGNPRHVPVLLHEVVDALAPRDGGIYVDGTFGAGGYSRAILERANCAVYAIDRDPDAIREGAALVAAFPERLTLIEGRFADMVDLLAENGVTAVDGVTLDIGVSSMQLDRSERGFSFMHDGPLDMRMEQDGPDAAQLVNNLPESQLKRIIAVLGEEKRAHTVVRAIARARKEKPFTRTGELAKVIEAALGRPPKGHAIHPATRTFQALRIFVNNELDQLAEGLAGAEQMLKTGGRLAVVTFHSLEDRIVKRFLVERTGKAAKPSRHLPQATERIAPSFSAIRRGSVTAGDSEIAENPRARSARLRVAERTSAPAFALDSAQFGMAALKLEGVQC